MVHSNFDASLTGPSWCMPTATKTTLDPTTAAQFEDDKAIMALMRRKRFEMLDEKGLMVVAIIHKTNVEHVVMSVIFVAKFF
ncbi:hypothetical protein PVAP13_9KG043157 [Panicum virgatum]|uniref:Uncharacterized protein n=1 Tax=Panicum virgatum TaxID=38727 RepID=A0A8T0NRP8_PANVG|nr:hypothetical protein PVAP13_9KG043157 [Panicum virgatum]KAG2550682.1 hypothetical protein PVAP13_9KG043157 [Panicum virgatum]